MILSFLAVFGFISAISASLPISPADYQDVIGPGFSTNWFKTADPLSKYNGKNIEDIFSNSFRNVRLRSRADLYAAPYNNSQFTEFLTSLTTVVDKCLEVGVTPIISWIHHHAEAYATDEDRRNYVSWWKAVATQLKDRDYRLSFNLFTELGLDGCGGTKSSCGESLRMRPDKYNLWTSEVVTAIRATGGKNANRILILGSPGKTAKDLDEINQDIYRNDSFIMAEWHIYASGPNKKIGGQKYWSGDGTPDHENGRDNVRKAIKHATDFTKSSNILTYLGAWMPTDNKNGGLNETEVINFARFFAGELRKENIPWSLNVLDRYYDTENSEWLTGMQDIKGTLLNMSKVLENIQDEM
ncbi:cellulase/esterase CelE-like [Oculina patagonica]